MQSIIPNPNPDSSMSRRILPPQVDEEITFGIMWIRVGKLKLTSRKGALQNKFIIQFWGEKQPAYLETKSNPLNNNQVNTMIEYDIKCPVTYFKEYLLDMKKNLRIEVEDIGKVDFDITKFLRPNIDLNSRYVFDHFKGAFEIIGKHHRKIGSIELEMACNFNPELVALQIEDEEKVQQSITQQSNKKHENQKIKSPDVDKDMAIEILALDNPQLLNQFYQQTIAVKKDKPTYQELKDNRIPNSLYTEMSPEKFDPANYLKEDLNNKVSQARISEKIAISNPRKQSQSQQANEDKITQEQACAFPTIAKVLTYSNLKLGKSPGDDFEKPSIKEHLKNNIFGVQIQQNISPKARYSEAVQYKASYEKSPIKNIDLREIYGKQETQKPIFYKVREDALSEIKKSQPSESEENLLEDEKQILSRVVNLDKELQKSQVNSPAKSKKKIDLYQAKNEQINPQILQENDIRPVTQYNSPPQFIENQRHQTHQGKFPVHPPHAMKKHKPSSLVLNLLVEIETKSIGFQKKREKFHLIHRPYGCKQRIKLGPKFQKDQITIMCPVSEQLVSKMDKLPFIIEFWGAVSNQFLGFFKVNLSKIKKGFMLQGRLNEIAIKSSLLPIIIQKGQINIENVNGQKTGQCNIYAAIGTTAQVQMYLNTERKIEKKQSVENDQPLKKEENSKKKKNSRQQSNLEVNQGKLDLANVHILLTNFLFYIDNNSNKNIQQLSELMKKKEVTREEFTDFILNINPQQQKVKELVYLFKNMDPNLQSTQSKLIQTSSLKQSFDQYKEIQESIIKEFNKLNKSIHKRISPDLKDQITKNSSFNIIQKSKLNSIYQNHIKSILIQDPDYERQLFGQYFLSFFDEYVNTKTIFSEEKLNSFYEPTQKLIILKVSQHFYETLFQHNVSVEYLDAFLQENSDSKDSFTVKLWKFCQHQLNLPSNALSLWYWLCLCPSKTQSSEQSQAHFLKNLKKTEQRIQINNLIREKLATQEIQEHEKKAFEQTSKRKIQQPAPKKPQIQKNESASMTYSNIHQILNQNQTSNLMKNVLDNISVEPFSQIHSKYPDNILIEKQNINDSNSQSRSQIQSLKEAKCFEHIFSIKGVELFLEFPFDGECQINYVFPFDDEPIGSKKIRVFKNKHRYAINLFGQHKITIENDIQTYMNQIPVKFELINLSVQEENHEILLEGDLHPDELLLQNNTVESKVVPLFGDESQKVLGKVKIDVSYQSKETQKSSLGKETVYNLFLPKSGFVNFNFQVKLEEQKIRSQYQFEGDEFYVSMVLDFFHESKSLRPQYPPIVSKLYSNLEQEIEFCNSIKTTLNPAILEYIKQKTCLISLTLTYYSKQKGNYEKKDITFATLKIPLFNLIKEEGIEGNYAFKNKYGMFVGLCKGKLKYDRYEKKDSEINSQSHLGNTVISNRNRLNNYWILIHFKELVNFEDNVESTFIKFQTILNSTKFQTQKIHLSDDPLLFFNDLIAISLPEEQFMTTKIIPISIVLDQNQKFAMDISLRPITKKLNKQNYFVSGGYFLVVDENSELTKMRIGARVIVLKGNSIIEPFVTSYCNNINTDVLIQIDLKRDLENYPKLLDIFRNQIKVSKKTFEQSMRQILPHKNDKLPLDLMSSQLLYKLDLTPIVAENQDQVDSLVRALQGTMSEKALTNYIEENDYKMTNFHSQIISQYSFESLWTQKIDKNVEYFNLRKQIDILTLARKIKVVDGYEHQNDNERDQRKYKELRITIQQGVNFHYLYNGIKPNVLLKIPQLSYVSKIKSRSSQPSFNESLRQIVEPQNQMLYKNLQFLVYHVSTGKRGQEEEILIGNGKLNVLSHINLSQPKKDVEEKPAKVIISSTMSSKMKATLELMLKLSYIGENELNRTKIVQDENLQDASRIEEMIKDINKEMDDKKYMFDESSDQDY